MSVYVNHNLMIADSMRELHVMAMELRLDRTSYKHRDIPHYPINAAQRANALQMGAAHLTNQAFLLKVREMKGEAS